MNKVIIIGNLGKDPDVRYTKDGKAVVNLSVATSEKYRDRDGNKQEVTDWHRVVLFERMAEVAAEYLTKGSKVCIEGRMKTRDYEKDGEKRYVTEIRGDRLEMLSTPRDGADNGGSADRAAGRGSRAGRPAPPVSEGQTRADSGRKPASGSAQRSNDEPAPAEFDDDIPF